MVSGMLAWVFSPLLFHSEMSILLILLLVSNLYAGLLLLPALISWGRPRFMTRYESERDGHMPDVAPISS